MRFFRKLFVCFSLSFVLLFTACVTLHGRVISAEEEALLYPVESYIPENFVWEEVCPGISRFDFNNPEFPLIYHAVKIDLTLAGPSLTLCAYPTSPNSSHTQASQNSTHPATTQNSSTSLSSSNTQASQNSIHPATTQNSSISPSSSHTSASQNSIPPATTQNSSTSLNSSSTTTPQNSTPLRTRDFARQNNCIVAVNLSPFTAKHQIVGIHVADGSILSEPVHKYAAIYFTKETAPQGNSIYHASIEKNQTLETAEKSDFAFGGFFVVLEKGEVQTSFIARQDSRTGLGISEDGHTLFILVVEGERPSKSMGLSYPQCGRIFKAMGCSDALEMDGGDSSELCINAQSVLSYKTIRAQANSLGFCHNAPAGE